MKKILCTFLSILLVLSCGTSAFAVYWEPECNHLPQIYVDGFESKWVTYKDDPDGKSLLFPIDTDRMAAQISSLTEYAKQSFKTLDADLIYTCLYNYMWDLFGCTALEPDGYTMQPEVQVEETVLKYEGDGEYRFRYDARLDPVDIAEELRTYIEWVKADTGMDKFELVSSSYGSSVALAYIYKYGCDEFDSAMFCVPTIEGVAFVNDVFTGNYSFDPDAVEGFIRSATDNETALLLVDLLNKNGTLDILIKCMLEPALKCAIDDALHDVIRDIFATQPSMWSFVGADDFYDALEYIYGADYASDTQKYAQLIEKITYYHENIKTKDREILIEAQQAGVHICSISKYNKPSFPVCAEGDILGDGFLKLSDSSFGATTSMNGKTLGEGYTQQRYTDVDFLSDDGCIDASTGLLPYTTWYIKDLAHGEKYGVYYELINKIIYNNLDVFSDDTMPQFIQYVSNPKHFVPVVGEPEVEDDNVFVVFWKLIKSMFNDFIERIKSLFE